jgi:hypothetical protein
VFRSSIFSQRGSLDIFGNVQRAQRDLLSDDYDDLMFSNSNLRFKPTPDFDAPNRDDEHMRPVLDEILNF